MAKHFIKNNSFNIGDDTPLCFGVNERANFIWINPVDEYTLGNPNDKIMEYPSGFESIKTSITDGFWLADMPVSIAQWKLLGLPSKPWFNGKFLFGVSWLDSLVFFDKLNTLYQHLLPKDYIFSLPTELQWEFCGKQESHYFGLENCIPGSIDNPEFYFERTSLQKKSSRVTKQGDRFHHLFLCGGEWCFDIASYYSINIENWNGYLEEYWIGEDDVDNFWDDSYTNNRNPKLVEFRIVRGVSDIYYQRYMMDNDQDIFLIGKKEFYNHIGFRVCVRKKTKWDYPLLSLGYLNSRLPLGVVFQ